jgi:hypothetical protein
MNDLTALDIIFSLIGAGSLLGIGNQFGKVCLRFVCAFIGLVIGEIIAISRGRK